MSVHCILDGLPEDKMFTHTEHEELTDRLLNEQVQAKFTHYSTNYSQYKVIVTDAKGILNQAMTGEKLPSPSVSPKSGISASSRESAAESTGVFILAQTLLNEGQTVDLLVKYVLHPSRFYCHLDESYAANEQFMMDLNKFYSSLPDNAWIVTKVFLSELNTYTFW